MGKAVVDRNKIYAVKLPDEEQAFSLALYVTVKTDKQEGIAFYTPGERGHFIEGKADKETQGGFIFKSTSSGLPGIWEFTEVTYENFKEKYSKLVACPDEVLAQVSNTQELIDFYHKTFPA